MKRNILSVIIWFIISVVILCPVCIAQEETIKVLVDGVQVVFNDQQPIVIKDRIMVPLRAFCDDIGCEVLWSDKFESASVSREGYLIEVSLRTNILATTKYNGKQKQKGSIMMDDFPCEVNSRIMVPLRAISEALDCGVEWDEESNSVTSASWRI